LNLLDFSANKAKDLFLIDIYSDATIYGGVSETTLETKSVDDQDCCKK